MRKARADRLLAVYAEIGMHEITAAEGEPRANAVTQPPDAIDVTQTHFANHTLMPAEAFAQFHPRASVGTRILGKAAQLAGSIHCAHATQSIGLTADEER